MPHSGASQQVLGQAYWLCIWRQWSLKDREETPVALACTWCLGHLSDARMEPAAE